MTATTTTAVTLSADECFEKNEGYDILRFALIVYFGTPIAVFGIISNAVLIKCFGRRKRMQSPTLYLFALAISDFLICSIYLPFFTVDALAIYFKNSILYKVWHSYAMLLYGSSRVIQFASTYLVVCATFERFIVVANLKSLTFLSTTRGRFFMVISTLFMVLALRVPSFFDYRIERNYQCPVFQSYTFVPLLMMHEDYQLYNFYVICFLHILLPFLLLFLLNLLIIALMKKKVYHKLAPRRRNYTEMPLISSLLRKESLFSSHMHRSELRFATRTMVMITFTYLFCNIFNVIITVMENVFKGNRLMFEEDGSSTKFYTYTADLVSITVTINSFARIFVYFFCNPQFRFQLVSYAKQCILPPEELEKNKKICNRPRGWHSKTDSVTTTATKEMILNLEQKDQELNKKLMQQQEDHQFHENDSRMSDSKNEEQSINTVQERSLSTVDYSPTTTTSSNNNVDYFRERMNEFLKEENKYHDSSLQQQNNDTLNSCYDDYGIVNLSVSPTLQSFFYPPSSRGSIISVEDFEKANVNESIYDANETVNSSKTTLYV